MDRNIQETLRSTMTYGFALGVIVVIYSLILYLLNIMPVGILKPMVLLLVSGIIYFLGLWYFSKIIKKDVFGNRISYWNGFLVAVLLGFFASILISAYEFLQNLVIDPEYIDRFISAQIDWMYNFMYEKGIPDDQIMETIEGIEAQADKTYNFALYIKSVLLNTLWFSIIGFITAAIIRTKTTNPFEES
ncbi:MAG: DUF4199 domain-containing protein [Bacteroidales bacterium]